MLEGEWAAMVGTRVHSEVLFVVWFGVNILSTEGMPCPSSFPPDLGHSTECHLWAGVSVLAGWHHAPWSFDTMQDTGIDQIGILGDVLGRKVDMSGVERE